MPHGGLAAEGPCARRGCKVCVAALHSGVRQCRHSDGSSSGVAAGTHSTQLSALMRWHEADSLGRWRWQLRPLGDSQRAWLHLSSLWCARLRLSSLQGAWLFLSSLQRARLCRGGL